jgi:hypothetical protein
MLHREAVVGIVDVDLDVGAHHVRALMRMVGEGR